MSVGIKVMYHHHPVMFLIIYFYGAELVKLGKHELNNLKILLNRAFLGFSLLKGKTHGAGTGVQHQGVERRKKRLNWP